MNLLRKIFRLSNIGYLIFCIANLGLILYIFTNGFTDNESIIGIIGIYILGILISLSPIGEEITTWLIGGRKMKRLDMKVRIVPLLEIVFNKARQKDFNMPSSIKVKVIYDESANAYSIGRRTICVTSGLFRLSDEQIMGVLAHELGHISNRDSQISLIIGGSNLLIAGFFLIMQIISTIIKFTMIIIAIFISKDTATSVITVLIGVIQSFIVSCWIKISLIFVKSSMRASEYDADKFACELGYSSELLSALDLICFDNPTDNKIFNILNSTHPNYNDRIAKIQLVYGL